MRNTYRHIIYLLTDINGGEMRYTYDNRGRLTSVSAPYEIGAIGASDAFLNMRTIGADYELGIRSYKAYGNNATSYKNKGCVEIMIFSYTITGLKEMRR